MIKKLDEKKVKKLFEEKDNQADVLIELYMMCVDNFKDVLVIDGFPTVSRETNEKLFKLFMEFDKKHHPNVMPSGLWLNNGFSSLDPQDLENWEVDMSTCTITYREH